MKFIDKDTGEIKTMIYKLLDPKHPLVHSKMPEYVDSEEVSRKELLESMVDTMQHYGGIGLSANQVGLPYRMFVFGDKENYVPCFNPKIIEESDKMIPIEEGCLSYPGLFVKIFRPDRISVEFEDENGKLHKEDMEDLMCRVFQHEMDHMDGIDFTSRAKRMNLDIAKRKVKRGMLKIKKSSEFYGKPKPKVERKVNYGKNMLAPIS